MWTEYDSNKPVVTANWDRNAKREPKQTQLPQPKPKPKPKPKQPAKTKLPKENLPEVVFVTPPVTPPPPTDKIKPKADFKRDEEFWNLYNA